MGRSLIKMCIALLATSTVCTFAWHGRIQITTPSARARGVAELARELLRSRQCSRVGSQSLPQLAIGLSAAICAVCRAQASALRIWFLVAGTVNIIHTYLHVYVHTTVHVLQLSTKCKVTRIYTTYCGITTSTDYFG